MTYASVDDLKAVMPAHDLQLVTDWDGASDTIDDAKITSALEDATAEINGWIAKRVTLPIANPTRMLLVTCRDLARYRLHANIGTIPEDITKLRDGAIAWLKAVSRGEVSIGDEIGGDEIDASPGAVVEDGSEPVFTRDSLKGF